jgi:DNA repair protein RadB
LYYRLTSRQQERSERKSLTSQSIKLLEIAKKRVIPILITSQVYTDVEKNTYEPLGGHSLLHNAKTIVKLEKMGMGKRRAIIVKHRHLAEGRSAEFRLVEEGVSCEQPKK